MTVTVKKMIRNGVEHALTDVIDNATLPRTYHVVRNATYHAIWEATKDPLEEVTHSALEKLLHCKPNPTI